MKVEFVSAETFFNKLLVPKNPSWGFILLESHVTPGEIYLC